MSRRLIAALLALGTWTAGCNVVGPLSALPFMRPVPAAQDVLECDLEPSTMGGAGEILSDSGWPTPDQAVADLVDDGWVMPRSGYQLEAADAHQALYVFRNGLQVKLALLLSDQDGTRPNDGWVVIELRACQMAEFGPKADLGPDVDVWADPDGHILQVRRGSSHCDWQDTLILHWRRHGAGEGLRSREYVRDPTGVFRDRWSVPYDGHSALPADAVDTRYRHADARLWMAADRQSVYVVHGSRVERWPLVPGGIGCA